MLETTNEATGGEVEKTPSTSVETGAGQTPTTEAPVADASSALLSETDPGQITTPATWPDDWRGLMSGGDAEVTKRLSRYTSPANIAKALIAAQDRIRSGPAKPDASDEKGMAEWRKANGIPEKPEEYKVPEVTGYKWSDADKPALANFLEAAHESGMTQAQADKALGWYAKFAQEAQASRFEADKTASSSAEQDLITEWGPEYRSNKTLAARFLEQVPDLGLKIAEARMPDGTRLGDSPTFIRWAAQQGKMTYGDAAFVSAEGSNSLGNRLAEIGKIRDTDINRYYREKLDKEELDLMTKQERMKR